MTPTAHLRFCSERGHLLDLLEAATRDYATAAHNLAHELSNLPRGEYVRRYQEVKDARIDAQHAREALHAHQKDHGCG